MYVNMAALYQLAAVMQRPGNINVMRSYQYSENEVNNQMKCQ